MFYNLAIAVATKSYLNFDKILQRLLGTDKANNEAIKEEILLSKTLSGHPNIVDFFAAVVNEKPPKHPGKTEYLIVLELCSGKILYPQLVSVSRRAFIQIKEWMHYVSNR